MNGPYKKALHIPAKNGCRGRDMGSTGDIRWIVITDLDGTLLDHETYSMGSTARTLELLRLRCIPVVLCSSKTRLEIKLIAVKAGIKNPFVVENGAAIIFQDGRPPVVLGVSRKDILKAFQEMRSTLGIKARGFSEMTPEDLKTLANLEPKQAKMALEREYSEPFVLHEGQEDKVKLMYNWAVHKGLRIFKGGRFFHLQGMHDKGLAAMEIKTYYQNIWPKKDLRLIILGDSENDLDMLLVADMPILVKRPDGSYVKWTGRKKPYQTRGTGSSGWTEAIEASGILNMDRTRHKERDGRDLDPEKR